MKHLYLIGGTMGVGKTTVCQELKKRLSNAVFLDGDWCWDSSPFQVTEETKTMVLENITFLLNQFLRCSAYDNILFCWVMHEQRILDTLLEELDTRNCEVTAVSLICEEAELRERLQKDIASGIRSPDILDRSAAMLPLGTSMEQFLLTMTIMVWREISRSRMACPFQGWLFRRVTSYRSIWVESFRTSAPRTTVGVNLEQTENPLFKWMVQYCSPPDGNDAPLSAYSG